VWEIAREREWERENGNETNKLQTRKNILNMLFRISEIIQMNLN